MDRFIPNDETINTVIKSVMPTMLHPRAIRSIQFYNFEDDEMVCYDLRRGDQISHFLMGGYPDALGVHFDINELMTVDLVREYYEAVKAVVMVSLGVKPTSGSRPNPSLPPAASGQP